MLLLTIVLGHVSVQCVQSWHLSFLVTGSRKTSEDFCMSPPKPGYMAWIRDFELFSWSQKFCPMKLIYLLPVKLFLAQNKTIFSLRINISQQVLD